MPRRFLKEAMAPPAKAPGNWKQTHSLAVGTRETQHRHGYQQSLSQSLSGISTICGNWGAFPKGQHPSALQHFQWLPLLTVPQSSEKTRGRPYTPLMLETLGDTHLECLHRTPCWKGDTSIFTLPETRIFTDPDLEPC